MEAEPSVLDDYVLSLTPAREPRICLLPTAGGDSEEQIRRFRIAFGDRLCVPSVVSLFRLGHEPVPLREHLLAQDIVYVGGGSLINLLALWRAHGLDAILREAWQAGIVLAGLSAGSMCWFEGGITNSLGRPGPAAGRAARALPARAHPSGRRTARHRRAAAAARGAPPNPRVGVRPLVAAP
jgi:dipeptidase E